MDEVVIIPNHTDLYYGYPSYPGTHPLVFPHGQQMSYIGTEFRVGLTDLVLLSISGDMTVKRKSDNVTVYDATLNAPNASFWQVSAQDSTGAWIGLPVTRPQEVIGSGSGGGFGFDILSMGPLNSGRGSPFILWVTGLEIALMLYEKSDFFGTISNRVLELALVAGGWIWRQRGFFSTTTHTYSGTLTATVLVPGKDTPETITAAAWNP
jgi:hypothetical protein